MSDCAHSVKRAAIWVGQISIVRFELQVTLKRQVDIIGTVRARLGDCQILSLDRSFWCVRCDSVSMTTLDRRSGSDITKSSQVEELFPPAPCTRV